MYDSTIKKFFDDKNKHMELEVQRIAGKDEWDPSDNHQTIWSDFKTQFIELAQKQAKIVVPKLTKQIAILEAKIDNISNDPQISKDEQSLSIAALKEALVTLAERKYSNARSTAQANFVIQGETISKYWSNLNKNKKK
ncbi:hypothetical protein EV359DRAFT_68685 [Lentinula novae-zelandiae]|nr:hypothetical protein EV359DRAFT_68685 [Lentinula novae-zelandiae]